MDWSQQVQVYVSWVNGQLRKLPRQPLIRQLQDSGVKDGSVLGLLVEIISGHKVPGLTPQPSNPEQRLANINALLEFMHEHQVKMHAIEAEAVVEGDLKSIMRIVLALAAHFKPRSVRPNTVAAIMQGAAVSLANTKHQVLRSPSITEKRFDFGVRTPTSESRARLPSCRDVELEDDEEERTTLPAAIPLTPRGPYARHSPSLGSPAATEADSGCHVTPSSLPTASGRTPRAEDSEEVFQEVVEARALLEQLQQLLLSGPPDKGFSSDGFGDLRLQSPTADHRVRDLEDQLRAKEERLFSNELQLRRTALHAEAAAEEAVQLRLQLSEKEALMAAQQQQIDRLQRHIADVTTDLEATVVERCRLSRELAHVSDEQKRASQDFAGHVTSSGVSEQRTTVFDECMERLRSTLAANDPQHHLLDQMEHCFHYQAQAALGTAPPPLPPRSIAARRAASRPSSLELERPKDLKRQPITALQGFPIQRLDQPLQDDDRMTRLLYFTEKTITPYVVTIPKRSEEITLADVRKASGHLERPGGPRFRFLFKTHEPEFGSAVKEEVRLDASSVPTWEDKIVAWILEAGEPPS